MTAELVEPGNSLPEPEEAAPQTAGNGETPEQRPAGRPTTRAGRAAARAAKKAAAGTADKKPTATKSAPRKAALETRLTHAIASLATATAGAGLMMQSPAIEADGVIIAQNAETLSKAICRLADENPQIKAALERMLTAGAWSGVLAAIVPIAFAIMANHGMLPPGFAALFGAPVPQPEPPVAGAR